jgi:hypothetical protein
MEGSWGGFLKDLVSHASLRANNVDNRGVLLMEGLWGSNMLSQQIRVQMFVEWDIFEGRILSRS